MRHLKEEKADLQFQGTIASTIAFIILKTSLQFPLQVIGLNQLQKMDKLHM